MTLYVRETSGRVERGRSQVIRRVVSVNGATLRLRGGAGGPGEQRGGERREGEG